MTRYRSEALTLNARLDEAAHDLWVHFHRGARQMFMVPRESLALVLKDAQADPNRVLAGEPNPRARTVLVTRSGLWWLLTGKELIRRNWNLA